MTGDRYATHPIASRRLPFHCLRRMNKSEDLVLSNNDARTSLDECGFFYKYPVYMYFAAIERYQPGKHMKPSQRSTQEVRAHSTNTLLRNKLRREARSG